MAQIIRIEDVGAHVDQQVTVQGWLQLKTGKGKLQFLRVRDGTGFIQAVIFKGNVSEEIFEAAKRMPLESSLIVTGNVRADPRAPGIPGGFELDVRDLQVFQESEEYPIAPKEHGVEFLMDNRHLWLRSSRQWAILRVRATIVKAMRDWLDNNGFILVDTPILTPSAARAPLPSSRPTSTAKMRSWRRPANCTTRQNIFTSAGCIASPTFRAEKSKTRRHLQEFWMVEPEIAFCKLEQLLEIEEQYVSYIVQTTLKECAAELKLLERDTTHLERVVAPFHRISYDRAVEMINDAANQGVTVPPNDDPLPPIEWGGDFGSPHETYIASQFDKPVFVHHYPTAVKAFYMEPEPGRPEVCRSADLLAPEGYGEIIGGSERMSDPEVLLAAIDRHGLPREAYQWYIDLRRYGSVPHSGFGLGVERTVSWICGLDHIRETIAFPRMLGRLRP